MIGVLDSGVGGLSIYREIKKRFPGKSVIYLADKKNFPYGEKSEAELLGIIRLATETLISKGAKIVVFACNSATVTTISQIRREFDMPFVGIEPAVKQAAKITKNNRMGVLATRATALGQKTETLANGNSVYVEVNECLVEKIENNLSGISDSDIKEAILPFVEKGVNIIALGCTHYHFLQEQFERTFPEITFIVPTAAVVNHLQEVVKSNNIGLNDGGDIFLCSANVDSFADSLNKLLGVSNADIRKI